MGFPQPPEFTLYIRACAHFLCARAHPHVKGLVSALVSTPQARPLLCGVLFTCLSFPSPPSALWGLCALVLAPGLLSASQGLCSLLSAPCVCPPCCKVLCVLVFSHQPALFVVGFMCSSFGSLAPALCATRVLFTAQVCMPLSLSLHPGLPLHCRVVCLFKDLYAMPHSGPPLYPEGFVCAGEVMSPHSQFPESTAQLGAQSVSC